MNRLRIFFISCCLPCCLFAQESTQLSFLLKKLHDGGTSGYTMIFAHRGDWRNAPENSLPAFQNCIDRKIDGIEVDVQETKDGQIVIMHDATLDRTTNGTGRVNEKTLQEIKSLRLKNADKGLSDLQVPTFAEVLTAAEGKILILVDKWGPVIQKVLQIAEQHGSLNQLVFRSTKPANEVQEIFGDYYSKINYIPVLNTDRIKYKEELEDYLSKLKFGSIGLTFDRHDHPIFNYVEELHQQRIRVWYNSLIGTKYNGGYDDNMALNDPEKSYGFLLKKGADVIMTDRPFFLLTYLENNNKR